MASCAEEINDNITCNNFSKSISKSLVLEMSLNPNFSRISLFNSKSFVGFLNSFENVFLSLCFMHNKNPFFLNSVWTLINACVFAAKAFWLIAF